MNFSARKSLGQHFLHEGRVIERIIAAFHPQEDDVVIEIGPGRGALTRVLVGQVAQLHVIEIDRRLAAALAELPVRVWCRDALTVDYCGFSDQPIRVLGNLPYNISTPLLFVLLQHTGCIADLLLML